MSLVDVLKYGHYIELFPFKAVVILA